MSFKLDDFSLMQYLWDATEKDEADPFIEYSENDIFDLWRVGFIDTEHIPLNAWKKIVEPFKRNTGKYRFNHDEFMGLDAYRYKGELFVPFNPMKINEGFYSEQGVDELFEMSVRPSTALAAHEYAGMLKKFKETFRDASNQLIRMDKNAKVFLLEVLKQHPSPLRNLELIFDQLIQQHKYGPQDEIAYGIAKQVSSFRDRPHTKTEAEALALKGLTQAKTPKEKGSPATDKDKTVALKKIRRSGRGTRG